MSVRDLIASAISGAPFPSRRSMAKADQAIANLAAAGYRLIGPGELDRETIERCAAECDRIDNECSMEAGLAASCAAALRSLLGRRGCVA